MTSDAMEYRPSDLDPGHGAYLETPDDSGEFVSRMIQAADKRTFRVFGEQCSSCGDDRPQRKGRLRLCGKCGFLWGVKYD